MVDNDITPPASGEHAGQDDSRRSTLERWMAATPAMLHSIDRQGCLVAVSDAWLNRLGYTREDIIGRPLSDVMTEDSRAHAVAHALPEFFRTGRSENIEYQMVCKDGRVIDVLLSAVQDDSSAGQAGSSLAVITDVTARKAAERLLAASEARYRLLAEQGTDMIFQLDRDLVRRYVSPACREVLGYEPEEMLGVKPVSMVHPDDAARVGTTLQAILNGRTECRSLVNRIRHRDGHWVWVEARFRVLKEPATGTVQGIIGALRDISARKAVEDQLAEANRRLALLASQDGLTGLANRRAFDERLAKEHRRARRDGESLAVLMIDVDCFKAYNDQYGHPAGDVCLRWVGRAIAEVSRCPCDVVARYGGEEFAVLLAGADEQSAMLTGESIRAAVADLAIAHLRAPRGIVTISVGVAAASGQGLGLAPMPLMSHADRALYAAKEGGRNRVMRSLDLVPNSVVPPSKAA